MHVPSRQGIRRFLFLTRAPAELSPVAEDVTPLLAALSEGHDSAVNKLLPVVYYELGRLRDGFLQRERPDHTLQATALVHKA